MVNVFEWRNYGESFEESEHITRVGCIGDSLMWGYGVRGDESLAAHLTKFLNAARPEELVWVDNFGQTSGNLWHSWPLFKWRCRKAKFDALVLSICNNDAQLFESADIPYEKSDKEPYWAPGSVYLEQVRLLLLDMASFCREHGIAPVVMFYSFVETDRPFIQEVGKICDEAGLPFLDLLTFYKTETGITATTYIASEYDGHPSGMAHELAARQVTKRLQADLKPAPSAAFSADPKGTASRAIADLVDQGVAVDAALDWAQIALAAKEQAARRRLKSSNATLAEDCAQLVSGVAKIERSWRTARRIDAHIARATGGPNYLQTVLPNLHHHVRNLDESVFLLEVSPDEKSLERLAWLYGPENYKGRYYDQEGRLDFFTGDIAEQVALAKASLAGCKVLRPGQLGGPDADLVASARLRASLMPFGADAAFSEAAEMADRLLVHLDRIERVAAKTGGKIKNPNLRTLWGIILATARYGAGYVEGIDRSLVGEDVYDVQSRGLWTCCDVVLEGEPDSTVAGDTCLLIFEVDYRVPNRLRARSTQWAGVAKERGVYRFEVPIMVLGDVRVGVAEDEPTRDRFLRGTTRIARIDIYNSDLSAARSGVARGSEGPGEASSSDPVLTWSDPDSREPMLEFSDLFLP